MTDTEADVTVLFANHWLLAWTIEEPHDALEGIGGAAVAKQNRAYVQVMGPERQTATISLFISPAPLSLWGHDLSAWGVVVITQPPFS